MSSGTPEVVIYDTTLRDGAQSEDVLYSAEDKLRILERLDDFGIDYVEGGWPGANPKDVEFFQRARQLRLRHTRLAAFGSTRRAGNRAEDDPVLTALLDSGAGVLTLFGKSWDLHVERALRISLEQNLELIFDSVRHLKSRVDQVFYDAEHFFDGYRANPEYARRTLEAARDAGADALVLCDTNGGTLTADIQRIVAQLKDLGTPLGIHCHNDADLAVANTLAAVSSGVVHVQGTINGIGERCGNANLVSVIPNLMLKMQRRLSVNDDQLARLCQLSRFVNEMANRPTLKNQPYVGPSAFAHKGGIHVSAVLRDPATYEHVEPQRVGNRQRVLVSEQAGKSNLTWRFAAMGLGHLDPDDPRVAPLLQQIKDLEHQGYQFDGADASFELMVLRALDRAPPFFHLRGFRVIDERRVQPDGSRLLISDASVKVAVGQHVEHTAAEGNGPLNALDKALRKALIRFYPELRQLELADFKVRILDSGGTAARVRVWIESTDGHSRWGTVGVSENIVAASYEALVDAVAYKLLKDGVIPPQPPADDA
ncbi:MAG: citramalate synthase [Magnetococcus sp. WYHC-3]